LCRLSDVYAVITVKTRLDFFESMRTRTYGTKFAHTRGAEAHLRRGDANYGVQWRECFEFLADEPQVRLVLDPWKTREGKSSNGTTL
jgi:hypothetical protein